MSNLVNDIKISKIQTSDGEQHEINAKYWGNITTDKLNEYATKEYVNNFISGGVRFKGVFQSLPVIYSDRDENGALYYYTDEYGVVGSGDVVIVAENNQYNHVEPSKEYILVDAIEGFPQWIELGDVSATDQRLTEEIERVTGIEEALSKRISTNSENIEGKADKTYVDDNFVQKSSNYIVNDGEDGNILISVSADSANSNSKSIAMKSEFVHPGDQFDIYSFSDITAQGSEINLSIYDASVDHDETYSNNLKINKDGLQYNGSPVVTVNNATDLNILKIDGNNELNKNEITVGGFEIKNDKPYNYTFQGVYSSEDRVGDTSINIVAEYNHEGPKLKTIVYDDVWEDASDVWCYEFIVTEFSLDEGYPEEYFEDASSIIGLVLNIPAAYLDADFTGVRLLEFDNNGNSENVLIYGITDEFSSDIEGHFIRTAPFSLKQTSKVLLNGSPVVTETSLYETIDNVYADINEAFNEISRVEGEVLKKVIYEGSESKSSEITYNYDRFDISLRGGESVLSYCIEDRDAEGDKPYLTLDGKDIATQDYVNQKVVGGIRFGGIEIQLPWEGEISESAYEEYLGENHNNGYKHGDIIIVAPQTVDQDGDLLLDPSSEYILVGYEKNLENGETKKYYHWELLGETTVVDKRITDEIGRATDEETKLNTAITGEISRAVAKENELLGKINANTTAISNKANKSDIPTKTSQLTNDSNYVDKTYVDDSVVIVKGGNDNPNSAVLKGEYEGYSNKAISQVSVAVGAASTSGLKGWYYDAITFDDTNKVYKIYIKYQNKAANGTGIITSNNTTTQPKIISTSSGSTNSSFKSGYEVGDVISLVNDKKYEDCSTITAINGNVLTVDKLPFVESDMKKSSLASIVGYEAIDEFSIYCIKRDFDDKLKILTLSKYDKGDVDFGGGSLSEGVQTYAINIGAHAEGAQTVAKGQYSHAEGIRTIANYASHAEGAETIASGSRCHAEGYKNEASGDFSHVEGDNNVASGVSSHAEGYNTRATSNQSHAEGGSTNATGKQSHAEGWSTTASGLHAHAEGGYTIASAWNSHAGGNYSVAGGNNSFAHGDHVNTNNDNEVAFGQYNKSESDTLFSIGNGTDENNRSNILEVKSIENDSEVKYEYFAPSGDIIFYHNKYEFDTTIKALIVSYFDTCDGGEYVRYKVEYVYTGSDYDITNMYHDSLKTTISNIKENNGFLYLPLNQKPQCEIDLAEREQDCVDLIGHSIRTLYISTNFTEENAILVLDYQNFSINAIYLKYSEYKTNNSALFVNGQRVLVEGSVTESKDWSDDINNAKKQAISESNTYTDSKIFISRNTSSTGIIDTGCIYKGEEFKNVAKGCGSVAIGAGVLSKSDGAITLGWSDIKTISSDSTLSTNDDYLNKWKELTNITDETIGSTTQAGFSASLGNNSVSLGRNNLSIGPQSTSIGMRNLSIGNHAVALGGYNIARGHDSVAMGQGCITNNTGSSSSNRGEFACGRFNKSVSDTQFSLGIGTSATKRKNALEIKTNGKHYIYGVGGYDGTNSNDTNDVATVLSNISKDIDGIKQSDVLKVGSIVINGNNNDITGLDNVVTNTITTNNVVSVGDKLNIAGSVTATGQITATGFYQSSDERLKTFTSDYDIDLENIKNIKTGKFYWNFDENMTINGGVSAQTVEMYFPELVNEDENGFKSVNYDGLAVVAIAAIKKLTERIEQLEEIVRNK